MRLKLIVALVSDEKTDIVIDAARAGGATGATIITSVRGEGFAPEKTIFGLDLTAKRDVVLFLVVEPRARDILERIREGVPLKLIIFNGVLGGARAPHCQERRLQRDRFATTMTILNRSDCFGAARAGSEWPARHAHSSACPNA